MKKVVFAHSDSIAYIVMLFVLKLLLGNILNTLSNSFFKWKQRLYVDHPMKLRCRFVIHVLISDDEINVLFLLQYDNISLLIGLSTLELKNQHTFICWINEFYNIVPWQITFS